MDTALSQKFPFILDRNLVKVNCTENRVCTSCDTVVLGSYQLFPLQWSAVIANQFSPQITPRAPRGAPCLSARALVGGAPPIPSPELLGLEAPPTACQEVGWVPTVIGGPLLCVWLLLWSSSDHLRQSKETFFLICLLLC